MHSDFLSESCQTSHFDKSRACLKKIPTLCIYVLGIYIRARLIDSDQQDFVSRIIIIVLF